MVSPLHLAPFQVSPIAGRKRPAPALLPAFEPLASAPRLPRRSDFNHASPSRTGENVEAQRQLPSAPTSSTFMPTSSPPQPPNKRRQPLQRTVSALSERTPLATLPSIKLDGDGKPTLMGRSMNSSHYQLSTNKLISRVHVRAVYIQPTSENPKQVQIECTGWNGIKVHCQGRAWDLYKGDTFTSETDDAELMIDVQDARVLIKWPCQEQKIMTPTDSEGTFDSERSPSRYAAISTSPRRSVPNGSPLRRQVRPQSPVSPSPIPQSVQSSTVDYPAHDFAPQASVHVYEDDSKTEAKDNGATQPTQSTQLASQLLCPELETFSDDDEENDPIVHSFGPYGANLNSRMKAFRTSSSPETRRPLNPLVSETTSQNGSPQPRVRPSQPSKAVHNSQPRPHISSSTGDDSTIQGLEQREEIISFTINHLMYSQLSATPLSTLLQHVRAHSNALKDGDESEKGQIRSSSSLHELLHATSCIGTVQREGKDAAGKPLESEYYYIPEQDHDPIRQDVVRSLGIGGRGLRNCRKSHKQYFWRKPKK